MNDFIISTKVIPDTSEVQSRLNKSAKSLKINARLNIDMSQFEKQLKKINNAETGNMFKVISQKFKDVEYNGQRAVQVVEQFSDGVGHIKERTTYLKQVGDNFKVLGSEITKASTKFKPFEEQLTSITTNLNKVSGKVVDNGKEYDAIITTTTKSMEGANGLIKSLTTTTTEYTNSQGENVKITQQVDEKNRQVGTTIKEVSKIEKDAIKTNKNLAQSNQKVGQSFSDIITKVAKFYLATLPIRLIQKIITDTISTIKELDDALVEFRKVSNLNNDDLDKYIETLSELGTTVGRTTKEMIEGATTFKKAGFSEADSAKLAQIGALYQNTADEILTAAEASSVIISQMKAFNYTADDAIHILDSINKVSADFAVSSGDIGRGLTQAGAALQTYGNSFDETVGLVTAGTEIFQGKSQQVKSSCLYCVNCEDILLDFTY